MGSFKIKYKYSNIDSLKHNISKYPQESGPSTITSTTAFISIIINQKLVKGSHWASERLKSSATTSGWLWYFCEDISSEVIKINDRKLHKVIPIDDPTMITFVRENGLVNLSASAGYVPIQTKVRYFEFMQEIFNFVNSFVSDLITINPRISENHEFKRIMEGRDKIKKMLEEAKNVPGLKDVEK